MVDDTSHSITVNELKTALESQEDQAKVIYETWIGNS